MTPCPIASLVIVRDDGEVEHVMCHTRCNTRLLVLLHYWVFMLYYIIVA